MSKEKRREAEASLRKTAREKAERLVPVSREGKGFPNKDITLFFIGVAVGIAIVLVPPQSPLWVGVWLCVLFLVLIYPTLHFAKWVLRGRLSLITYPGAILILAITVSIFGRAVWPQVHRHFFTEVERNQFEQPLKDQMETREEIQIMCPVADESSCVYAGQFIDLFRQAGWKVQGNQVDRITLAKPLAGVVLFQHGSGTLDPDNWQLGLWSPISPSLENVRKAFVNVGIEPDSGANPNLPGNIIAIYFGLEKKNQAERTRLTAMMEVVERERQKRTFPRIKQ